MRARDIEKGPDCGNSKHATSGRRKGADVIGALGRGDDVAPQPVSEILAQTHGEAAWIEAETRD